MAAIVIDSPRWRDGWGDPLQDAPRRPEPALRLVDGGHGRPRTATVRRRRLVVVVAAGLVLAALFAAASVALTRPATAGAVPVGRQVHVVQPGDTYWSIAAAHAADGTDLRLAVDALIDANGARSLFPGDRIELPR